MPPLLIGSITSPALFASYSISMRLINVAGSFQLMLAKAIYPSAAKGEYTLKKILVINLVVGLIPFIILTIYSEKIINLFLGPSYAEAAKYMVFLAPSIIFVNILYALTYGYFLPQKRDREFKNISLIVSLLSASVGYYLIFDVGVFGAIIMFIFARFLFALLYCAFYLKYEMKKMKDNTMKYDYLIVGAGLYGAVCAHKLSSAGKKVLVIEKRDHIAGNIYTQKLNNINVHKYGAHIFHTNDKEIWNYVNSFVEFNRFTNSPMANYKGDLYNLPFNMNTFHSLWGVITPNEAKNKIENQKMDHAHGDPKNLEEQALSLVGRDIYEKLIKGYTEKQWGRKAIDLPSFIIQRLPVRFTYDNNYFSDKYQGIPEGGYTAIVEKMLENVDVQLNINYLSNKEYFDSLAKKVIYTGPIDAYFQYQFGTLQYRSLRFENEYYDEVDNFQGNAVVNYTEYDIPYTRIIEHKHFEFNNCAGTIVTKEYPAEWKEGDEPYYPVNDPSNMELYKKYRMLAKSEKMVHFGGRLAEYKYYDMHQVIRSAFSYLDKELAS